MSARAAFSVVLLAVACLVAAAVPGLRVATDTTFIASTSVTSSTWTVPVPENAVIPVLGHSCPSFTAAQCEAARAAFCQPCAPGVSSYTFRTTTVTCRTRTTADNCSCEFYNCSSTSFNGTFNIAERTVLANQRRFSREPTWFRFKITDPCMGFSIQAETQAAELPIRPTLLVLFNSRNVYAPSLTRFYTPDEICPGSPWLIPGDAIAFYIPASTSSIVNIESRPIWPMQIAPEPAAPVCNVTLPGGPEPLRCLADGVNYPLTLTGPSCFEFPLEQRAGEACPAISSLVVSIADDFLALITAPLYVYVSQTQVCPLTVRDSELAHVSLTGGTEVAARISFSVLTRSDQASCGSLFIGVSGPTPTGAGRINIRAQYTQLPVEYLNVSDVGPYMKDMFFQPQHLTPLAVTCPTAYSPSGNLAGDDVQLINRTMGPGLWEFDMGVPHRYPLPFRNFLPRLTFVNPGVILVPAAVRDTKFGYGDITPNALSMILIGSPKYAVTAAQQCTVHVRGLVDATTHERILNIPADGQRAVLDTTLPSDCSAARYQEWKGHADSVLTGLATNQEPYSFAAGFFDYLQLFGLTINTACGQLVSSLSNSTARNLTTNVQACLSSPSSAPSCCLDFTFEFPFPLLQPDIGRIRDSCPGQFGCISASVSDYATATRDPGICTSLQLAAVSMDRVAKLALAACSNQVYGHSFFEGVPCTYDASGRPVDSACPGNGTCDVYSGTCNLPRTGAERAFLECMESRLPKYSLQVLKSLYGLSVTSPLYLAANQPAGQRDNACVDTKPSGPWNWQVADRIFGGPFRELVVYSMVSFDNICGECSYGRIMHSVGPAMSESSTCRGALDTACAGGNIVVVSDTDCASSLTRCNWNAAACPSYRNRITSFDMNACRAACLAVPSVCAVCHDDSPYECRRITAPLTAASCEQQLVCEAQGTLTPVNSQAECDVLGSCTVPCTDDVCIDRGGAVLGQCISSAGVLSPAACAAAPGRYFSDDECLLTAVTTSTACLARNNTRWVNNLCTGMNQAMCALCEAGDPTCNVTGTHLRCIRSKRERPCANRTECEANSRCSDRGELASVAKFVGLTSREFVCILPKALGYGTCGGAISSAIAGFTFGTGCALFAEPYYTAQNVTACTQAGGSWYRMADSQSACLAPQVCMQPPPETLLLNAIPNNVFVPNAPGSYITQRPAETCLGMCSGSLQPAFQWLTGTWRPGRLVQARNVTTSFGPMGQQGSVFDTLDFSSKLDQAVRAESVFALRSFVGCVYPALSESISAVTVLCALDRDNITLVPNLAPLGSVSLCFEEVLNATSGADQAFFGTKSLALPGCAQIDTYSFPSTAFATPSKRRYMPFFTQAYPQPRAYEAVQFDGGAVGQILGNGFGLNVSFSTSPGQELQQLEYCSGIDPELPTYPRYVNRDHSSIGFARYLKSFELQIVPELVGYFSTRKDSLGNQVLLLCAQFDADLIKLYLGPDETNKTVKRLYPVAYDAKPAPLLSTGERVSTNLVALCYAWAAWFAVLVQLRMFLLGDFYGVQGALRVFFSLGLLVRAIYFFLVANDVILRSSPSNLALAELPYVFYFTGLSCVICLWALFNFLKYLRHAQISFWVVFIVVNSLVYLIFFVLIILGATLPNESKSKCFGQYEEVSTDAQFGITIALMVFNAVLAVSVSLALLFLGLRLFWQLRTFKGKSIHLLVVAFGGSVCYFASSIIMIGVAISAPPVFVAWVLAVFEIPPCIFVIILVSWTPERRSFSGIHSYSKSVSTDESAPGQASHVAVSSWRV